MPGFTSGSSLSTTSCEHPKRISAWEGATSANATSEFQYILHDELQFDTKLENGISSKSFVRCDSHGFYRSIYRSWSTHGLNSCCGTMIARMAM